MMAQEKKWTVKDLLFWITERFHSKKFQSPILDAQLLMCHALNYKNRIDLYINSEKFVNKTDLMTLREYVSRRLKYEPVAYILNQKYWYNLDLYIDSHVLIPRPETESLLDFILETVRQKNMVPRVIFDFCTGSGCLAIALAKHFPDAKVFGFDISLPALNVARKNAVRNHTKNVEFIQADLTCVDIFQQLSSQNQLADIIVANPPYISEYDWNHLDPEVKHYEPKMSLVSQEEGLLIGKKIVEYIQSYNLLQPHSIFGMELAHGQPAELINSSPTKITLAINAQEHEKPINQWCIVQDLEFKERFLFKISEPNNG